VQLNHRAICQIYELGRLDGSFYIVMEYIAGRDLLALQNWFRKRRRIMSVAQAVHIAIQVCEGLDYAHRKVTDDGDQLRIIHRDVSPQNILVSYDGDVKVIDFGIARAATTNQVTQVGVLKGKFGYMSPEQVDAKPLDRRSDVFAVGTLLWEMLTARRLFYADSDYATLEKVRSGEILPPSTRNNRVPEEIDRIVLKALDRDMDQRYQWASEFAADLRAFLSSASPNYGDVKLSAWMVSNFQDLLDAEREKIATYSRFVTIDDVHSYYAENPDGGFEEGDGEDEEEEEATQVFDPNRHGAEELLAENELQPLPVMVEMSDGLGTGLPDVGSLPVFDSEPSAPADYMADLSMPEALPPLRLRKKSNAPLLTLLAVLVAAIAVLGLKVYQSSYATGALTITTIPPDASVYIDGEAVVGASPFTLSDVAPGTRIVEIRHPDFMPALAQVEIEANVNTSFDRELESLNSRSATVALVLSMASADVYLDGSLVGGQGPSRSFEVGAAAPHTVEVFVPDHFVEVYEFDLGADARFERRVDMRPVRGSISVESTPVGTVFLDGQERGSTEGRLTIEGLDVHREYVLEIRPQSRSFLSHTQTVILDPPDLLLAPRLPRRGTGRTEEAVAYGVVITSGADRWYRVLVDERDTGFVTPITADAPLLLKTGDRQLTFVRPGDRRDVRVNVLEGRELMVTVPEE
jgi:hypothetical protein